MSNMKPKKPAQSRTRDFQLQHDTTTRETAWGPVMVATYAIGEHTFEQAEVTFAASERITAMLVEAKVVDILSFNDLAGRTNADGLLAALTKAGKVADFLALVLTLPGGAGILPSHFADWPNWVMEPFVRRVIEDFFATSPSALSGLRALSMPELALKTAAAGLTTNTSTSLATETFPGSR